MIKKTNIERKKKFNIILKNEKLVIDRQAYEVSVFAANTCYRG